LSKEKQELAGWLSVYELQSDELLHGIERGVRLRLIEAFFAPLLALNDQIYC
jgi:hypothetical protein